MPQINTNEVVEKGSIAAVAVSKLGMKQFQTMKKA